MTEAFVEILEDFLGVRSVRISLSGEWLANGPRDAEGKSLKDFLAKVSEVLRRN